MKTLPHRYLELVKSSLVNEIYVELEAQLLASVLCAAQGLVLQLPAFWKVRDDREFLRSLVEAKAEGRQWVLELESESGQRFVDDELRNYTQFAHAMVGRRRLDHLQECVEQVVEEGIPGDLLEAGVWRGGCCVLLRAVLESLACRDRRVWVCDSFQGPPPSRCDEDLGFDHDRSILPVLAVPEASVRELFRRFDLMDDQVRFIPGWFRDSLPDAPVGPLAILRVDADLFESTLDALVHLHPKVSPGGWVIVDDYHALPPCRAAVDRYRSDQGIRSPMTTVDAQAVAWRVT